jgi:hypothetical protein
LGPEPLPASANTRLLLAGDSIVFRRKFRLTYEDGTPVAPGTYDLQGRINPGEPAGLVSPKRRVTIISG